MNRIIALVKGEFKRLAGYNLLTANIVVLLVWVVMAYFLQADEVKQFIPIIFFTDAVMMNILLTGATIFYEKKEHTVNSILVSPVSEDEYIISKLVTGVLNSFITVGLIAGAMFLVKGITFNLAVLIPAVILVSVLHTLIGLMLTYATKDFTGLLLCTMAYIIVLAVPPMLGQFGIFNEGIKKLLVIVPTGISLDLINACIIPQENWRLAFGYIYLPILTIVLYRFVVKPFFNSRVTRETGV